MEKRYKYMNGYLSRDLLYQKIHLLRDAAFGADCLIPLRILKIMTVGLKMDSGNAIKDSYMLADFNLQSSQDNVSASTVQISWLYL